ncbi:hypothetical protein PGT21_002465 [Puccinia graminis f. sp. tritici]|uniref:Secreted protein n=1 Tax=Puccinia graminis f. sp. tritici TaxID=56615 RepID=A0A5B0Q4G7_PUCGR|nr:hypothetical protein PGT21_002465 [Puccinia graminis f. sp. tritici]
METNRAELWARAVILLLLVALADPRSISIIVFLKRSALETRELAFQLILSFQDNPRNRSSAGSNKSGRAFAME